VLPLQPRLWLVASVCACSASRTFQPHTARVAAGAATPDLRADAGTLGMVWGFDLGLLFTTQKVVSLIWAGIAAAVLLDPAVAGLVVVVALLAGMAVAGMSVSGHVLALVSPTTRLGRLRPREVRWVSGVVLLILFVATALQAGSP